MVRARGHTDLVGVSCVIRSNPNASWSEVLERLEGLDGCKHTMVEIQGEEGVVWLWEEGMEVGM